MARLYVGNLEYTVTEAELEEAFRANGCPVENVKIIIDRELNRSKGFGFLECEGDAHQIIQTMQGQDLKGRSLLVQAARPRS